MADNAQWFAHLCHLPFAAGTKKCCQKIYLVAFIADFFFFQEEPEMIISVAM